jgi:hypothetical protein
VKDVRVFAQEVVSDDGKKAARQALMEKFIIKNRACPTLRDFLKVAVLSAPSLRPQDMQRTGAVSTDSP